MPENSTSIAPRSTPNCGEAKTGRRLAWLLCRGRDRTVVEYTLRDINKPLGVSEYTSLPPALQDSLPTVEQLEEELRKDSRIVSRDVGGGDT